MEAGIRTERVTSAGGKETNFEKESASRCDLMRKKFACKIPREAETNERLGQRTGHEQVVIQTIRKTRRRDRMNVQSSIPV